MNINEGIKRKHIVIIARKFFNKKSIYEMIISKEKTIESRWSMNKIAPYNKVSIGDILYIKETGKPVTAKAIVKDVKYYELTDSLVEELRIKYGKEIGNDNKDDWKDTYSKKYCSLIWLDNVELIEPFSVKRSCGTAWFVLND